MCMYIGLLIIFSQKTESYFSARGTIHRACKLPIFFATSVIKTFPFGNNDIKLRLNFRKLMLV